MFVLTGGKAGAKRIRSQKACRTFVKSNVQNMPKHVLQRSRVTAVLARRLCWRSKLINVGKFALSGPVGITSYFRDAHSGVVWRTLSMGHLGRFCVLIVWPLTCLSVSGKRLPLVVRTLCVFSSTRSTSKCNLALVERRAGRPPASLNEVCL